MYANGMCPSAADGTRLPCPEGYGGENLSHLTELKERV